ncbi:hypothetical protein TRFO_17947 [Tritrichomonas foetus]|uniref:Myb-like DNA-binding domain containing protein n=1 Tax=Tritrichomonas foetus TaxID=1144522 RepID=A0A1J4KS25_9EUKA|nr:hypothetical protein TRFO_17947 [Tritrichomonas foetus]|eukprot:OHT12269.1 hypothetical protein TRFO_17947 [Tritrichomonas foetus]
MTFDCINASHFFSPVQLYPAFPQIVNSHDVTTINHQINPSETSPNAQCHDDPFESSPSDSEFILDEQPEKPPSRSSRRDRKYAQRKWTEEEDALLRQAYFKNNGKNWKLIAREVRTRTHKQCRERWHSILSPLIKHDSWSYEEDKIIIDAFQEFGSKWALIAKKLSGRTQNGIKNRYYYIQRRLSKKDGDAITLEDIHREYLLRQQNQAFLNASFEYIQDDFYKAATSEKLEDNIVIKKNNKDSNFFDQQFIEKCYPNEKVNDKNQVFEVDFDKLYEKIGDTFDQMYEYDILLSMF